MADHEDGRVPSDETVLSRRGFLGVSGATAAAVAGLGSAAGMAGFATTAQAAIANRTYFSNVVGLELDGQMAGLVESAEGGEPGFNLASGAGGQVSLAGPVYESLTLVPFRNSQAVYDWIMTSSQGKPVPPRSLAVVCYDVEGREWYRMQLDNARIVEVQLDAVDVMVTDRARLRIKVSASTTRHQFVTRPAVPLKTFKLAGLFQNNCRFVLDNNRDFSGGVRAVGPIAVRIRADGVPDVGAIKLEINPTALGHAYRWMDKALAGTFEETAGALQLWSGDLKTLLASVSFDGLGILRVTAPVRPSSGTTPLAALELYARGAKFNLTGLSI